MMSLSSFALYIMTLAAGYSYFYGVLREHMSGVVFEKQKVAHYRKQVDQLKFEKELIASDMLDFQQYVAGVLPEIQGSKLNSEKDYPLRKIASIVKADQGDQLRVSLAKNLFSIAKRDFSIKDYKKAIISLKKLIHNYSFFPHLSEVYFLLGESQYKLGRFEGAVETINKMVLLFPSNELTGYALLRLGKIYEHEGRVDESIDLYKTVQRSFPYRGVASQAKKSLSAVKL